jgi:hypothetical protein
MALQVPGRPDGAATVISTPHFGVHMGPTLPVHRSSMPVFRTPMQGPRCLDVACTGTACAPSFPRASHV